MTKEQFEDIVQWQKETFPKSTDVSKLVHLEEELEELAKAILDEDHAVDFEKERAVRMEYADCFLLLFGSAACYGLSYEQICKSIDEKVAINKERKWGNPDKNGVVKHVK